MHSPTFIAVLAACLLLVAAPCHARGEEPDFPAKPEDERFARRAFEVRPALGLWIPTIDRENLAFAGFALNLDAAWRFNRGGALVAKARFARIEWDAHPYSKPDQHIDVHAHGLALRMQFVETGRLDLYGDLLSFGIMGIVPSESNDNCSAPAGLAVSPALGANLFMTQRLQFGAQVEYLLGPAFVGRSCTAMLIKDPTPPLPEIPGLLQFSIGVNVLFGPILAK